MTVLYMPSLLASGGRQLTGGCGRQVFERKDIKYKEDIKHLKAKTKKLGETAVKEQERGDKAKEGIARQEKSIDDSEKIVRPFSLPQPLPYLCLERPRGALPPESPPRLLSALACPLSLSPSFYLSPSLARVFSRALACKAPHVSAPSCPVIC